MSLVNNLIQQGWLKTPHIVEAFKKIKRRDFLPADLQNSAEFNEALPIGYEQTISQPLVVAFMLELLQPNPGDKILDLGAGSGWTAALLAQSVGEKGKVIAIERIPELKNFGEQNVAKYNFVEKGIVKFVCADGSKGYPQYASCPELAEGFDKILASASAEKMPFTWQEQLKIGGRLVSPVESSIWLFVKKSATEFEQKEFPGFAFVPLVKDK